MGALCCCTQQYEAEAKEFVYIASIEYYALWNRITEESFSLSHCGNFREIFSKMKIVKDIGNELVEISKQANYYYSHEINDRDTVIALNNLRKTGDLFILGDEYFSSVLTNVTVLKELANFKNIEPYTFSKVLDSDVHLLAFYPDLEFVIRKTQDPEELKYYWITWRNRNYMWASLGFYTIVESINKASKLLNISALEFWFRSHNSTEIMYEMETVMKEIEEPFKAFHAFLRHELYIKYGAEIVDPNGPIPVHIFHQVLMQAWAEDSVIEKYFPFADLPPYESFAKNFNALEMILTAADFYKSLGFGDLDSEFLRNRMTEHDDTENVNNCRADIYDTTPKVYMKYCKKVNFKKFLQNFSNLARIYYAGEKEDLPAYFFNSYYLEYSVGEAILLSASTPRYLSAVGLTSKFKFNDNVNMNRLFRMAIHSVLNLHVLFVNIKVMYDLFGGNIGMDAVNQHFWNLMEKYVGVEPPADREKDSLDFTHLFYLDIEKNRITKKFLGEVLGYQFYNAFYKKNTNDTVKLQNFNFYGHISVGNYLKQMMALGSSKPWNEVLSIILPDNAQLSGDALLEYYEPIFDWIRNKNLETKVRVGWSPSKIKVL